MNDMNRPGPLARLRAWVKQFVDNILGRRPGAVKPPARSEAWKRGAVVKLTPIRPRNWN